jgi:hypothetical protein
VIGTGISEIVHFNIVHDRMSNQPKKIYREMSMSMKTKCGKEQILCPECNDWF